MDKIKLILTIVLLSMILLEISLGFQTIGGYIIKMVLVVILLVIGILDMIKDSKK